MNNKKNIVIKLGTTSIIENDILNVDFIDSLAINIKTLKSLGINTLIVTSGAVCMAHMKWTCRVCRNELYIYLF